MANIVKFQNALTFGITAVFWEIVFSLYGKKSLILSIFSSDIVPLWWGVIGFAFVVFLLLKFRSLVGLISVSLITWLGIILSHSLFLLLSNEEQTSVFEVFSFIGVSALWTAVGFILFLGTLVLVRYGLGRISALKGE